MVGNKGFYPVAVRDREVAGSNPVAPTILWH